MKKTLIHGLSLLLLGLLVVSCGRKTERSSTTNWKYNDQKWGGFEKLDYEGQATGPNLVMIEGGTFTQGLTDQDVTFEWNNVPRRVTVSSFYMDETEVANIDYREYLFWVLNTWGSTYPEVWKRALPDTLVWREELAYNEPLVETYFRHPAYDANTFQNDVAVLKLNRNVTSVSPIAIVNSGSTEYQGAGQSVVVAGWGTTSVNKIKISLQLRMTNLTLNSQATCEADYPGDFDNATMMCASSPGRDSCQGDSGGPLLGRVQTGTTPVVVKGKKHKGKKRKKKHIEAPVYSSTQVGVVSWGFGCAVEGKPGVYARLSEPGINSFVNTSAAQ